jgi:GTP-binding protein
MQEANMDPKSLFSQDEAIPHFQAHYISPKDFGHELPSYNIPQVAFLGRSNVGKSSLVNALLRSKDLAKCSKQPGRTQQVNYYGMYRNNCQNMIPSNAVGYFIDLPGYGFAKAPPDAVRKWQEATQEFLINRRDANVLTRLFVLVDARRGATQIDRDIMGWFDEAGIAYSVVLTKADRVSRAQIVRFVNEVCMRYHAQVYGEDGSQGPIVHVTSARDGQGISELLTSINAEFIGYREALSMMRQGGDEGWTSGEQDEVNEDDNDFEEEPEDISR